eukprot:gene18446-biopygen6915
MLRCLRLLAEHGVPGILKPGHTLARVIGTCWLGVARAWRGRGAGVARACPVPPARGRPGARVSQAPASWCTYKHFCV